MDCLSCKANNPTEQKFCGDCGAYLGPEAVARDIVLRQQVETVVTERLKDQKVVEVEVAQAIASRFADWAKLLGLAVALPLTLLAAILGVLGVKDYQTFNDHIKTKITDFDKKVADFDKKVADIQKTVDADASHVAESNKISLDSSKELLERTQNESRRLTGEFQRLQTRVDANSTQVTALTTKFERIERIGFEGFSPVQADLQRRLEKSLHSFQEFLLGLGYEPKPGSPPITVKISRMLSENAYYNPSVHQIMLAEDVSEVPGLAEHAYAVRVFSSSPVAQDLPGALLHGLADYFTCSFLDEPLLAKGWKPDRDGKNYIRNLDNKLKFEGISELDVQHGGEIWGGAFWEVRKKTNRVVGDRLLYATSRDLLVAKEKSFQEADFVEALLAADTKLEMGQHAKVIRAVFEGRGLKIKK